MAHRISVNPADLVEALQMERRVAHCHDEFQLAQNDLKRFVAHMRALYNVPAEYVMTNWLEGFELPKEPGEIENAEESSTGSGQAEGFE